jgi:putative tryptophan/tyrosine transport system substrate-binding protein
MKRREFIVALGGAAAWPLAARAQQRERMRRVGVLMAYAESDPEAQARVVAFRQGLRELGWTEGHNVQMDYRYGTGEPDRARIFVAELLSLAPDVIVAHGTPALTALHRATRTIPVVFVSVIDPVGAGYVQSLALPGGNITGFSTFEPEIGGKWLELLKEVAPGLRRVAGILDPGFRGFAGVWRAIENMAPRFGLEVTSLLLHAPTDDLESAVDTFAQGSGGSPAQPAGQAFLDGLRESGFYRRTLSSSTALPRTARSIRRSRGRTGKVGARHHRDVSQRGDGGGETGKYSNSGCHAQRP